MISYAFTVPDSSFPRSEAASLVSTAREGAAPDEAGSRPSIASALACSAPLRRGRVPTVNRNAAFGVGALLGAAAAVVWGRRSRLRTAPAPEARQRELREKLAGAQQAEAPAPAPEPSSAAEPPNAPEPPSAPPPPAPPPPAPPPPASPPPAPPPPAPPPPAQPPPPQPKERSAPPSGPPPADEFEAMRRRIHQEGKAAAEEMRRAPDEGS
jgi:hypothetical protein